MRRKLRGTIGEKQAKLDEQMEAWQRKTGSETLEVTVESIAEVVSRLTGIPVTELTQEERQKLLEWKRSCANAWSARTTR
jgi:ATPases with chaperone activity, ATP-binding subunit